MKGKIVSIEIKDINNKTGIISENPLTKLVEVGEDLVCMSGANILAVFYASTKSQKTFSMEYFKSDSYDDADLPEYIPVNERQIAYIIKNNLEGKFFEFEQSENCFRINETFVGGNDFYFNDVKFNVANVLC